MKNVQEIINSTLLNVLQGIETIENIETKTSLRIELLKALIQNTNIDINHVDLLKFKGNESIDTTKKKRNNSKAQIVEDALNTITKEPSETIIEQPEETIHSFEENTEAIDEQPENEAIEENNTEEEEYVPMLMESEEGDVDIKPVYDSLVGVTNDSLDEIKQFVSFYATIYDLSAIVSSFSSEITSNLAELLNNDNIEAFYEFLLECLQSE